LTGLVDIIDKGIVLQGYRPPIAHVEGRGLIRHLIDARNSDLPGLG